MSEPVIVLKDVSFGYAGPLILEDVQLCIHRGEFLAIVGPNGSGKSTLLKLILGLLEPKAGSVSVLDGRARDASIRVGYVPQFVPFDRTFPINVLETVLMGRLGTTRMAGGYLKNDYQIAHQVLAEVGMAQFERSALSELSGGQLQRVMIARALAGEPEIIIMDEPTANIDPQGEEGIFEILKRLNSRATVIVVSHDVAFVSRYVTRVACVNRNVVCHETSELNQEVLEKLYGSSVHLVHHHSVMKHEHTEKCR